MNEEKRKERLLRAKATIEFIRANPGCTRAEIIKSGIKPNFIPIMEHRLAYWTKAGRIGNTRASKDEDARWWPNSDAKML